MCVGFGFIFHLNFIGFSAWEELFCQITHPACNPQVESVLLHVVMSATLQKGGINGQTFFLRDTVAIFGLGLKNEEEWRKKKPKFL